MASVLSDTTAEQSASLFFDATDRWVSAKGFRYCLRLDYSHGVKTGFLYVVSRLTKLPKFTSGVQMRILFLGDLVGKPGYSAVLKHAEGLRETLKLDALVVNAENASDGSGLMPRQFKRLMEVGVDGITLGDHIYKCRDIIATLNSDTRIVKPANYPQEASGRTWTVVSTAGGQLGIISLMGRVFMRPVDCPMAAADRALEEIKQAHPALSHILVDVHAEATSDKQTIGRYLDGKVTAVIGTHTHVPTADTCIFPGGTAFQCDAGMCGPYESIIGRDIERVTSTARSFEPIHFHVATRDVRLCGVIIDADHEGRAVAIERFEQRLDASE